MVGVQEKAYYTYSKVNAIERIIRKSIPTKLYSETHGLLIW